ncbi:MAG: EthD domain-containing protein [Acidimicrobiales bacterium]|nr:EthD domain-containing protein [Acidimicrobiales bacterium]
MQKVMVALHRSDDAAEGEVAAWAVGSWGDRWRTAGDVHGLVVDTLRADRARAGRPPSNLEAVAAVWLGDAALADVRAATHPALADLPRSVAERGVWLVEEHRQKVGERPADPAAHVPSQGFKLVSLMRPAPGVAPDVCARHWVEQHGPLARRIHQGMWHYTQNVVLETLDGDHTVFGIAELHFRTEEDYTERFYVPPEGAAEIMADVERFLSVSASTSGLFTEHVLRTPTTWSAPR